MKALRFCIEGCGRETGAYSGTGRKNQLWCPECDEKRIRRIEKEMIDILDDLKKWDHVYNDPRGKGEEG